jgi:hypothetical protein
LLTGSITGGVGFGHSTGRGVHLLTMGAGVGAGVGRSHLMVLWVGSCVEGESHLMGVMGVSELVGAQRIAGVRAALPRLSLKLVSAERALVTMMKERMSFIG